MRILQRTISLLIFAMLPGTSAVHAQLTDVSDAVFSIVIPAARAQDVDMGRLIVGDRRDSLVADFIVNTGRASIRIDTIFIAGGNVDAFSVVGGLPPVHVPKAQSHGVAFAFHPAAAGNKAADIVLVTQVDTQRFVIRGEGVTPQVAVEAAYVDFGTVPVGGVRDTLVEILLRNLTAESVDITASESAGPDTTQFSILSGAAPCTIPPLGTHAMALRFMPRRSGRTSGSIRFALRGGEEEPVAQLFGEGIGVQASVVLCTDTITAAPGEIISIPIRLQDATQLQLSGAHTVYTELRYRASLLVPVGHTPEGTLADGLRTIPLADLPLLPLWDDIIAEYSFMAVLGDTTETALELIHSAAIGGNVLLREQPGQFLLRDYCREGGDRLFDGGGVLRMEQNRPNPFNSVTIVEIETIEAVPTRLVVRDLHGRTVHVLYEGIPAPGVHRLVFEAKLLPSGTYLYELWSGSHILHRSMQLLK
ncbi:MAG: choice-of-anchor D domain-containing protein [Bacteroidetes bacterium]|nr:choice-of-anchor D domain-containing protein [Bacteroidota bacterium]